MKKLLLLLTMFYTTSANATELKPFIGTGGQFQFMILYSTWSDGDPRDYSDIYPSLEPYIEVGCQIGKWEIYGTHEFNEPRGDEWIAVQKLDTISLTSQSHQARSGGPMNVSALAFDTAATMTQLGRCLA